MKYRDRTEIITLILTSASTMSGVLKTGLCFFFPIRGVYSASIEKWLVRAWWA